MSRLALTLIATLLTGCVTMCKPKRKMVYYFQTAGAGYQCDEAEITPCGWVARKCRDAYRKSFTCEDNLIHMLTEIDPVVLVPVGDKAPYPVWSYTLPKRVPRLSESETSKKR